MKPRNYPVRDVDMLMAASTIVENATEAKDFLVEKRPAWADPFLPDLQQRISNAFVNILGLRSVHELRRITQNVYTLMEKVLKQIAELKVQLRVDYADDKENLALLLDKMGIGKTSPKYRNSQENLVETLQRIQNTITPELRSELQAKGISPALVDDVLTNGQAFLQANLQQETMKGEKKTVTDDGITELNAIYAQTVGIAKIARTFYKGQPVEQDKFSFKKIVAALSGGKSEPVPQITTE